MAKGACFLCFGNLNPCPATVIGGTRRACTPPPPPASLCSIAQFPSIKAPTICPVSLLNCRWDWEGVYATAATRIPRDVRGHTLPIKLVVLDKRQPLANRTDQLAARAAANGLARGRGPYRVSVLLQVGGALFCEAFPLRSSLCTVPPRVANCVSVLLQVGVWLAGGTFQ